MGSKPYLHCIEIKKQYTAKRGPIIDRVMTEDRGLVYDRKLKPDEAKAKWRRNILERRL